MDTIKPGDVVLLNSGGPKMTVQAVRGLSATCGWPAEDGSMQSCVFDTSNLTPSPSKSKVAVAGHACECGATHFAVVHEYVPGGLDGPARFLCGRLAPTAA